MNGQLHFSEFLAWLDKACEKMNAGLGAIATVLAVIVLVMAVIRASEIAINLGDAARIPMITMPGDQPALTFWTYD